MSRHAQDTKPEPAWITEMTALSDALIDHGIRAGMTAMRRTPGLAVDPWASHDVLALALRAALTAGIPLSATVEDVLDRLTVLQGGDIPEAS